MLWVTRYPLKGCVVPSSILTGTETSIAFLHSPSTATRFGSMAKVVPTRRSCSRASSNGFSRRWVVGTTAVTLLLLLSLQTSENLDAAASLARWVGVEGEVPRIRKRVDPARRGSAHSSVDRAEAARGGGRTRERSTTL